MLIRAMVRLTYQQSATSPMFQTLTFLKTNPGDFLGSFFEKN